MDSEFELLVLGRDYDMVPIITAWDFSGDRTVVAITPDELLNVDEVIDFDYDQHSNVWAVSTSSGALMAFEAGSDCLADMTGDGQVDGQDLAELLSAWGATFTSSDQNGDGQVNGADLSILIGAWGECSE